MKVERCRKTKRPSFHETLFGEELDLGLVFQVLLLGLGLLSAWLSGELTALCSAPTPVPSSPIPVSWGQKDTSIPLPVGL